jgi:hypothetical protein
MVTPQYLGVSQNKKWGHPRCPNHATTMANPSSVSCTQDISERDTVEPLLTPSHATASSSNLWINHNNIFLFIPNIIGYTRIILAVSSLYFMRWHPKYCTWLYSISCLLDAFDGMAARKFGQSMSFFSPGVLANSFSTQRVNLALCWIWLLTDARLLVFFAFCVLHIPHIPSSSRQSYQWIWHRITCIHMYRYAPHLDKSAKLDLGL